MSTIKDKNLARVGQQEVDWAARQMKVLEEIKTEFSSSKPLNGLKYRCLYACYKRNS